MDAPTMKTRYVGTAPHSWGSGATQWRCTIHGPGGSAEFDFYMGSALQGPPEVSDVLESLVLDSEYAAMDFDEFCRELGLDSDSIRERKSWKKARKNARKLDRIMADPETGSVNATTVGILLLLAGFAYLAAHVVAYAVRAMDTVGGAL